MTLLRRNRLVLFFLLTLLGACSQSPDPELDLAPTIFTSPVGKQEFNISDLPSKRVMVALAFGQSNSGNSGSVRSDGGKNVYNYYRGKLYGAQDPLLGTTGDSGSVWSRLGRGLVASRKYDAVVLVTIGVANTRVADWAPGGRMNPHLLGTVRDLEQQGLPVTHFFWHQGESESARGSTKAGYTRSFLAMLGSVRSQGAKAPIYVSVGSLCRRKARNENVRQAQLALPDDAAGIRSGPDTDQLGLRYRTGNCHFTGEGSDRFADLWLEKLGIDGDGHGVPAPKPSADTYVMNFEQTPASRLVYGVKLGSGVVHEKGSNPKAITVPVVAQPRRGGSILSTRQARVLDVYGGKRLTVASPRSNTPSPQGGRIRLRFAPALNPSGVDLTSVTLSNLTSGAYLRFFYVGGGSSLQRVETAAPGESLVVPLEVKKVRAVDIVARSAFAVDDLAFVEVRQGR